MKKIKKWYTLEKSRHGFTVWENKEGQFSYGSRGLFTGTKQECEEFAKEKELKIVKKRK